MPSSPPRPSRWPHGARAAVAFTMDNLGEAQDVRTGSWLGRAAGRARKYGTHPAVWDVLPRILGLLGAFPPPTSSSLLSSSSSSPPKQKQKRIRATYFAEAWSLPVYPHVLPLLLGDDGDNNAGGDDNGQGPHHELAWHGYQHEPWHTLSEADEAAVFARSFEVIASAAATVAGGATAGGGAGGDRPRPPNYYRGFRPPGGRLNGQRTLRLLRQYGIRYVSPLGRTLEILRPPPQDPPPSQDSPQDQGEGGQRGERGGVQQENEKGIVVLPFEWEAVDAFWYMEKFAATRKEHGVQEAPLGPDAFRESLFAKLDAVKHEGGYMSILFHPFLTTSEDRFQVLHDVLERLRGDPEIWVAPCHEVAEWVSEHADQFGL